MSAYMVSNVGIGDLCKHSISMSAYIFNNIGIGDLCQHRLLCLHTWSVFVGKGMSA